MTAADKRHISTKARQLFLYLHPLIYIGGFLYLAVNQFTSWYSKEDQLMVSLAVIGAAEIFQGLTANQSLSRFMAWIAAFISLFYAGFFYKIDTEIWLDSLFFVALVLTITGAAKILQRRRQKFGSKTNWLYLSGVTSLFSGSFLLIFYSLQAEELFSWVIALTFALVGIFDLQVSNSKNYTNP